MKFNYVRAPSLKSQIRTRANLWLSSAEAAKLSQFRTRTRPRPGPPADCFVNNGNLSKYARYFEELSAPSRVPLNWTRYPVSPFTVFVSIMQILVRILAQKFLLDVHVLHLIRIRLERLSSNMKGASND